MDEKAVPKPFLKSFLAFPLMDWVLALCASIGLPSLSAVYISKQLAVYLFIASPLIFFTVLCVVKKVAGAKLPKTLLGHFLFVLLFVPPMLLTWLFNWLLIWGFCNDLKWCKS
jgi:hypothetical protein